MLAKTPQDVERIRGGVQNWRRLSDRLFSVGGFGVGLDGLLTWVPVLGGFYGVGVGGYLLAQAYRVRASKATMVKMAMLTGADALVGEVPILGDAFDFLFRAHSRSAKLLQAEIDRTHFVDDSAAEAHASGRLRDHHAHRTAAGKKRLVFLKG